MTVQVQEHFAAWPVVAAGMTVAGAVLVVFLTHYVTRRREKLALQEKHALDQKLAREKYLQEQQASEERRRTELQFIGIELIFLLEAFAEKCARVAQDNGEWDSATGKYRTTHDQPQISFDLISGDWKVLPDWLMYQIRELPVRELGTARFVERFENFDVSVPGYRPWLEIRQEWYAGLGIRAVRLSRRLRHLCAFPPSPLAGFDNSALHIMWGVKRNAVHQTIAILRMNRLSEEE